MSHVCNEVEPVNVHAVQDSLNLNLSGQFSVGATPCVARAGEGPTRRQYHGNVAPTQECPDNAAPTVAPTQAYTQSDVTFISPRLSFVAPEFYGSGISVKEIDFQAKGTEPPFKSTYFEILPGFTTPVDKHKVEECWLVLQGSGILDYDGHKLAIAEQDIVHFHSFKGHSVHNNTDKPLLLCSIYW